MCLSDLDSVPKLQNSPQYIKVIQKVEGALTKEPEISSQGVSVEDDPEYQLIVECGALLADIEDETTIIHNFILDKYSLMFPELESLVHNPINYARDVKNDVEGLLIMAGGKPLPEQVLQKTIEACDRALALDADKKKVLGFVESRMPYIAPNLSALVGSAVAAKLVGTVMPACNVGAKRKTRAGSCTFGISYVEEAEILESTPPALRTRACRLLAARSTLAARYDYAKKDPMGEVGRSLRDEILKKIEQWQQPVPDSEPEKKRGGHRLRKVKERYAVTGTRKLANRLVFGAPEESSLGKCHLFD